MPRKPTIAARPTIAGGKPGWMVYVPADLGGGRRYFFGQDAEKRARQLARILMQDRGGIETAFRRLGESGRATVLACLHRVGGDPAKLAAAVDRYLATEQFPRVGFIVTNLSRPAQRVVRFYNQRGTAEQWIKEGKNAVKWTRLSCHDFVDNQVRLQLFLLAYNLGNFLRQAVLPQAVRHWTLTTLREKLIKIGAKVVRHSRQVIFQMAEVAVPRELFRAILRAIERLRLAPAVSG